MLSILRSACRKSQRTRRAPAHIKLPPISRDMLRIAACGLLAPPVLPESSSHAVDACPSDSVHSSSVLGLLQAAADGVWGCSCRTTRSVIFPVRAQTVLPTPTSPGRWSGSACDRVRHRGGTFLPVVSACHQVRCERDPARTRAACWSSLLPYPPLPVR